MNAVNKYLVLAGFLALAATPAMAATSLWDGGAGTTNWNDAANWSPDGVPANGAAIQFGGGLPAVSTIRVNVANAKYTPAGNTSLTFSKGVGFTLDFSASSGYNYFPVLNVSDSFSYRLRNNASAGLSFGLSTPSQTFSVAPGGRLVLSGNFVVSGYAGTLLTKTGGGELDLSSDLSNFEGGSFNGLDVQEGVARLTIPPAVKWVLSNGLRSANGADVYLSGSNSVLSLQAAVAALAGNAVHLVGVTLMNDALTANWTGSQAGFDLASDAKLDLRGHNTQDPIVAAVTGSGQVVNTYNNAPATLTIGANNGSGAFSGSIRGNGTSGDESGVTALLKIGTGTQTLTGAHTYSGSTTISEGTLYLAAGASLSASLSIAVAGNATASLRIAPGASLSTNVSLSVDPGGTVMLETGVNQVVSRLLLNGQAQPVGSYGSSASDATYQNDAWFSGPGKITTAGATQPPSAQTLRIHCVGDSITYGATGPGGYRPPLGTLLANAGYSVEFVGTQSSPAPNHDGHPSYRIEQIEAPYTTYANAIPDPDLTLLLIGINDFFYYQNGYSLEDIQQSTNRLDKLITRMVTHRPHARLIVSNPTFITTTGYGGEPFVYTNYGQYVSNVVAIHAARGEPVTFIDLHSVLGASDLGDGVHPNLTGYNKLAAAWFNTITNLVGPYGSTNPPVISRAEGQPGGTNVTVTFSKPVTTQATTLANYTLNGGLSVLRAALDASKRVVNLTTTPQTPGHFYTVTVNNVRDGTPAALVIATNSAATFLPSPVSGATNNVAEAAGYSLVYSLSIPNTARYNTAGVPYDVDHHAAVTNFDRIAYYLELQHSSGSRQFIWVSMNAFTTNSAALGVPSAASGAAFQQYATNMNVLSSVPGIVNGSGLSGGYLEFWPGDYTATNSAAVAGASSLFFDWSDTPSPGTSYGSMQVHNVSARQTLWAFNGWGNGAQTIDLGISNGANPQANYVVAASPDWTHAANAASYSAKTLQVFVHVPLALSLSRSGDQPALSWTGTGAVLEQTTDLGSAQWEAAANQANPQVLVPSGAAKFFRLRQ